MSKRVVFDTNTVLSALLFPNGRLAWLRSHWQSRLSTPLASKQTVEELLRVLSYPKFKLSTDETQELLADYLLFAEHVDCKQAITRPICRDPDDQPFVTLAVTGRADILVTGDKDLLALRQAVSFVIETPAQFQTRYRSSADRRGTSPPDDCCHCVRGLS